MKTTLHLSDNLFKKAKLWAAEHHTSFRDVVETALNQFFASKPTPKKKFKLKNGSFKGDGLCDGLVEGDWETIRSMIYEGRGG